MKEKDQEINELKIENQKNEEIAIKLTRSLTQYVSGWKIEKKVYDNIISDLRLALHLINPEKTDEYIRHLKNRYSKQISRAEKCFMNIVRCTGRQSRLILKTT